MGGGTGRDFSPAEYLSGIFELDDFEQFCVKALLEEKGEGRGFTASDLAEQYGLKTEYASYFWSDGRLLRYFFQKEQRNGRDVYVLEDRIRVFLEGKLDGYGPYDFLWEIRYPDEFCEELTGTGPAAVMERFLESGPDTRPVLFHLYGPKGSGRKSRILEFCSRRERPLLILDGSLLDGDMHILEDALRECRIYGAYLFLWELPEHWFTEEAMYKAKLLCWMLDEAQIVFTAGEKPLEPGACLEKISYLECGLELPDYQQSVALWEKMLDGQEHCIPSEWANKFLFTPGQIRQAVESAWRYAFIRGHSRLEKEDLQKGCYYLLREGMGRKAVKIQTGYTWEDLVLPPVQKQMMKEACSQVLYKKWVYEEWGFDRKIFYGKGISIVFAGPPGTGKTMAAQVMASELCLDLYRIELAAVVSKYVGETEKNLEEIFEQAKKSQVILFFDEADVLFSKRMEVRDSNDKYSNMEAAFLLQKMEEYEGITILATNYLQNFDEAFRRRMKFIIDFPFPDAGRRELIWRKAFPKQTPLCEDLDYEFLASGFEMSGSSIKNAALHAAFLAAASSGRVSMKQIIAGIRNEFAKNGKILTKEQLGQYYMLLDQEDGM